MSIAYTVNQESRYLIVENVPALGLENALLQLLALHGAVLEYRPLHDSEPEVPSLESSRATAPSRGTEAANESQYQSRRKKREEAEDASAFCERFWIKFEVLKCARIAKRKIDDYYFYGNYLHVRYAPEYETVDDVREKLQDRRRTIAAKTGTGRLPQDVTRRTVAINDPETGSDGNTQYWSQYDVVDAMLRQPASASGHPNVPERVTAVLDVPGSFSDSVRSVRNVLASTARVDESRFSSATTTSSAHKHSLVYSNAASMPLRPQPPLPSPLNPMNTVTKLSASSSESASASSRSRYSTPLSAPTTGQALSAPTAAHDQALSAPTATQPSSVATERKRRRI